MVYLSVCCGICLVKYFQYTFRHNTFHNLKDITTNFVTETHVRILNSRNYFITNFYCFNFDFWLGGTILAFILTSYESFCWVRKSCLWTKRVFDHQYLLCFNMFDRQFLLPFVCFKVSILRYLPRISIYLIGPAAKHI